MGIWHYRPAGRMYSSCVGETRNATTLIKAQLSALNVATERVTSDKTEATHFSQCAHDQQRRLEGVEAEDCDSIRCAQLISGGRRRIRPPHCLAHARPTMCCIRALLTAQLIIDHTHCIALRLAMRWGAARGEIVYICVHASQCSVSLYALNFVH